MAISHTSSHRRSSRTILSRLTPLFKDQCCLGTPSVFRVAVAPSLARPPATDFNTQSTEYPANGSSSFHDSQCLEEEYGQAARLISTSKLNVSLRFHTWPINLVVYQEPSEGLLPGRSHLVEGFTLRCIQRFSLPDVATRHCHWRDNRYTRGPSNPVLSY